MTPPLSSLECELLEAVLEDRENATAVLGDYWLAHVDEVRGAFLHMHVGDPGARIDLAGEEARLGQLVQQWRAPLRAAGYRDEDLVLSDGFLQWPLSIPADHVLDGDPDTVRLSPRYYRELRTLDHGSEGFVLEAEAITPRTKTRVAIKAPLYDDATLNRERAILATLVHPHLPQMIGDAILQPHPLDEGVVGRGLVLAWAGTDLRKLLRATRANDRCLGADFAISVAVQLFDALHALDRAVIRHGEVRADHVLVTADGNVTLTDFGYAVAAGIEHPRLAISPTRRDLRGRFRVMSPEQLMGLALDATTDVFSAATLISELVANEPTLPPTQNDFEVLALVRSHQQIVSPELPPAVGVPLQRALEIEPGRRPRAGELRDALVDGARRIRLDIGPHVIAQRLVELGVPT